MGVTQKGIQVYTGKTIRRLLNMTNLARQKAALANLRRGVGHEPGDIPQLWGEFLLDMPEEMYGRGEQPSREEWAVYTALTLFALHQQGHDPVREPMHLEGQTLGEAAAHLATDEDEMKRILRRLNAVATADSPHALSHYLRGLVQLLRAQGIPLDYALLAREIFLFQIPECIGQVRLAWGRSFYGYYNKQINNEEEIES